MSKWSEATSESYESLKERKGTCGECKYFQSRMKHTGHCEHISDQRTLKGSSTWWRHIYGAPHICHIEKFEKRNSNSKEAQEEDKALIIDDCLQYGPKI